MKQSDDRIDLFHIIVPDKIGRLMRFDRRGCLILLSFFLISVIWAFSFSYRETGHFYSVAPDTATYYSASEMIMNGQIDSFRTPLYPLTIGLMTLIFKNVTVAYTAIVVLQWLIYAVALYFFGKVLGYFKVKEKVRFCTLLFMMVPLFAKYNQFILTESLSQSFLIFLIWLYIKCYEKPSLKNQSYVWGMVLLMIALRPSWIFLIPVIIIFVALCLRARKCVKCRVVLPGILLSMAVVGIIIGYVAEINYKYHFKSISIVTTINNFSFMREIKTLPRGDFGNDELVAAVDSCYQVPDNMTGYYSQACHLIERFGESEVTRFVNVVMGENKQLIARETVKRFIVSSVQLIKIIPFIIELPIVCLYFFLLCWAYILCRLIYVRKQLDAMSLILFMLYAGIIITGIAGASTEAPRLIYTCLIPLMISLGICSNFIQFRNLKY